MNLVAFYLAGTEGDSMGQTKSAPKQNRQTKKNNEAVDIDFTKSLDETMVDIFAPPKNPKSLLLPVNGASSSNTLPEDCHYQPHSLVKLFFLPDIPVHFSLRQNIFTFVWYLYLPKMTSTKDDL